MPYQSDPSGISIGQGAGGTKQFTVTPDDNNNLDGTATGVTLVARALIINDTGPVNVAFVAFNDSVAKTWKGLTAGTIIPMYVKRVLATGTTATDILGAY